MAVANGEGDGIQLIEATAYRSIAAVRLGDDSDNVRYDAATGQLYVGFGSAALAAIAVRDSKVVGEAQLAGQNRRLTVGVVAGWMLLALVLAGFVALRMPITSGTGLIVQVTAQKAVFIAIAATFVYESYQAGERPNRAREAPTHEARAGDSYLKVV